MVFKVRLTKLEIEMNRTDAWHAWTEQDRLIQDAALKQCEIIKSYIEANRNSFKQVSVKKYYGSGNDTIEMLQVMPRRSIYYRGGHFYKKSALTSPSGMPVVETIVGTELSDLWKSTDFMQNLVDMTTDGGRMAPYE